MGIGGISQEDQAEKKWVVVVVVVGADIKDISK